MLINVKLPTIWHFNIYEYDELYALTQLSMKLQWLLKSKILKIKTFHAFKLSDVVLFKIMLINVKITSIVGRHFNIYEHDKLYAQLS